MPILSRLRLSFGDVVWTGSTSICRAMGDQFTAPRSNTWSRSSNVRFSAVRSESIRPRGPGSSATPATAQASNPYEGLRHFPADDTGIFFGREALVAEMLRTTGGGRRRAPATSR